MYASASYPRGFVSQPGCSYEAWATATNDERDKFGDYRSAEAIQATLENQTELLTALQGSHNRLGHDIETGKLRMCMAWESVAAAKAKEKRNE